MRNTCWQLSQCAKYSFHKSYPTIRVRNTDFYLWKSVTLSPHVAIKSDDGGRSQMVTRRDLVHQVVIDVCLPRHSCRVQLRLNYSSIPRYKTICTQIKTSTSSHIQPHQNPATTTWARTPTATFLTQALRIPNSTKKNHSHTQDRLLVAPLKARSPRSCYSTKLHIPPPQSQLNEAIRGCHQA